MGRFIAVLVLIGCVAIACFGIYKGTKAIANHQRRKLVARYAPELLRYDNLPPEVIDAYRAQRKQLDDITALIDQMLKDPVDVLPTQYYKPIYSWLCQRKELTK